MRAPATGLLLLSALFAASCRTELLDVPFPDGGPVDAAVLADAPRPHDDAAPDQAPPVCGDPVVVARFAACTAARDAAACAAAGGTWTIIGLAPTESCLCPTGQERCGCSHPAECLSACLAPVGALNDPNACKGAIGQCSSLSPVVGCWCFLDANGTPMPLCID